MTDILERTSMLARPNSTLGAVSISFTILSLEHDARHIVCKCVCNSLLIDIV